MSLSKQDLKKIAQLACLDVESSATTHLDDEINSIMNFVDQLRTVDTTSIQPLCHPLELHQRLRPDAISEQECIAELEAIAPYFEDNLYLVPKVIETDK